MTVSAAQHQAFARLLQQEAAVVKALQAVLKREHQALGKRDAAAITTASAEKEPLLGQLEQLAKQRNQILQQVGLGIDKPGFEAFIESDGSGLLRKFWGVLEELLRECQKQNQVNGILLESGKQVTQQAVSILTGREIEQDDLYDQRGKTSGSLGKNTSFKV